MKIFIYVIAVLIMIAGYFLYNVEAPTVHATETAQIFGCFTIFMGIALLVFNIIMSFTFYNEGKKTNDVKYLLLVVMLIGFTVAQGQTVKGVKYNCSEHVHHAPFKNTANVALYYQLKDGQTFKHLKGSGTIYKKGSNKIKVHCNAIVIVTNAVPLK